MPEPTPEEAVEVAADERPEWVVRAVDRMEAVHARVAAEAPDVPQNWVDDAIEAWDQAKARHPQVLLDDLLRLVLARVAPSIAEQAATRDDQPVTPEDIDNLRETIQQGRAEDTCAHPAGETPEEILQ